ncbi:hypothetical protein [Aestuariimicrobium ganziense]|uniref:hypothetical protein n=1 Tax=Aestuariimicrobium ganziense TaxID=2773677 RepID=UPI0019441293|nr:hypothetical protein [Aestuariimicrobium ganziense]
MTTDVRAPESSIVVPMSLIAAGSVFLTIQAHEYAHGLAGLVQTGGMWVKSGSADAISPGDATQQGVLMLAGPLFSLVTGALIYFTTRGMREGFGRWVATWLGLVGMMNFFGYLMTSVAGGPGDISGAITQFGWPGWLSIPLFFVGAAGMVWLSWLFCHDVRRVGDDMPMMRRLGVWPWLWGTVLVVVVGALLTLLGPAGDGLTGGEIVLSLMALFAALVFAPMFTFFVKLVPHGGGRPDLGTKAAAIVYFVVAVAIWAFHSFVTVRIGS